ncbi:MAG: A24 family peptidase [Alphaproteobacteria bacterium]|jgi:leader peptidase (prepilin peptidase)/N-methyltransferase|nr:A24 family peptidase [Alphaproteobacteria bacterium]
MFSYIFFIFLLLSATLCAILISVADFRRRIIPDAYLFPLMLIGLILIGFYTFPISIQQAAIGATFGYIMSATIGFIFDTIMRRKNPKSDTPIGMGDIKLLGVGGMWLGLSGLAVALIIACISGAIWARTHNQRFIPFAPFFFIGGFLSLLHNLFLL